MQKLRSIPLLASVTMLAMAPGVPAQADNILNNNLQEKSWFAPPAYDPQKDWQIQVGGGVMVAPEYEGSDEYEVMPVPDISVDYKDGLFFANIFDGIGSYPIQGEDYKVGASVGFALGRDEDDSDDLRGMGDIDISPTVNLLAEHSYRKVTLSGKISQGDEDYGTTAEVDLGKMFPVNEKLMIMGKVGTKWASEDHMKTYFGVSSGQSARSGYSQYDADAGFKSVGFNVGAFYSISERWNVKFMAGGDQLLGDAADSPIVKQEFQPSAFLTTGYKF